MSTFLYICKLNNLPHISMKKFYIYLSLGLLLLSACSKEADTMLPEEPELTTEESIELTANVQGIATVKFTEDMAALLKDDLNSGKVITKSSDLNYFVETLGITSIEQVFPTDPRWEERHKKAGLDRWYYIRYDAGKAVATKAAAEIGSIPGVEISEPVRAIRTYSVPNDPRYSNQWGFNADSGININVENVWANYTTGSSKVLVAVTDGGVQVDHPDLQGSVLPGGNGLSMNFVKDSYQIPADDHGTHVAGVIGAIRNNEVGVAGIAGGDAQKGIKGVSIMSCAIFDGDKSADATPTYVYAADNGAVISQNSWGYVFDTDEDGVLSKEEKDRARGMTIGAALKDAINYFITYAGCDNNGEQLPDSPMKGGIVIFAAGNDNFDIGQPAMYEKVLAVGAIDQDGTKAYFSNYGEWVDICAPGTSILSTVSGSNYGNMQGTSMACPHVSGVAALVLAHRGGFGFTNQMLWDCLVKGANSAIINTNKIGPLVDAMGATVYGLETSPKAITDFSVDNVVANKVSLSWAVPGRNDNNKAAYATTIFASTKLEDITGLDPKNPGKDVKSFTVETSGYSVGETVKHDITLPFFEQDYYIALAPYNYGPVYAQPSEYKLVKTKANNAPVFAIDQPIENLKFKPTQSATFNVTISEPDGHSFTSKHISGSVSEKVTKIDEGKYVLTLTGEIGDPGIYTAVFEATDSYKATSRLEVKYEILENTPPTIKSQIKNVLLNTTQTGGVEINLDNYFTDADEEVLTYQVSNSSTKTVHEVKSSREKLTLTPLKNGLAEIKVTAYDKRQASCEQNFKVLVRDADEKVSVYPTQVKTILYVGTGETVSKSDIKVIAQNGAVFFSGSLDAGAFEPAEIDMTGAGPGRYFVEVSYQGETFKSTVVKL